MILSALPPDALHESAASTSFPKWNTLCLLRLLGLPTLDATFIQPRLERRLIQQDLRVFSDRIGSRKLLVRSDGGREQAQYFRGGNSLPLNRAISLTQRLSAAGRAVICLEPTDRFRNRLTLNFLGAHDGTFAIEILGPGYDVSDLNRGGVPPHYVLRGELGGWDEYVTLGPLSVRLYRHDASDNERRLARLRNLAIHILPGLGVTLKGDPVRGAKRWLEAKGALELWEPWELTVDLAEIQAWYADAFFVAAMLTKLRRWKVFVLSASLLPTSRFIYWDVVTPDTKWAGYS